MRLRLVRRWHDDDRTIGELYAGSEWIAYTMEPGRKDTEHPRIPTGFYALERHDDPGFKYRDTWALVGRDVSHQVERGVPRAAVLFHAGNLDEQTRGCILLGLGIGRMNDEPSVTPSGAAMDKLRATIGKAQAYLVIEGG